jgi:primosomal protein N' (replication factor Y)
VVGLVLARVPGPPPGIVTRPIDAVLDAEPLVGSDLLDLARFTADYYCAPVGEVVRAMLPLSLPAWGEQRVELTDRGALALVGSAAEEAVRALLLERGRSPLAELLGALQGGADLDDLEDMAGRGLVAILGQKTASGSLYRPAVELASGSLEELLERCGRAAAGRSVIELLAALGRPARVAELTAEIGCGPAVVRRLERLGIVRRYLEVAPLELDRHLIRGQTTPVTLRADQERAATVLEEALATREYRSFLLAGMTGSGKTEVYLRGLRAAVAAGRGAIVLVPEIALVPALATRLRETFGLGCAILHSNLSRGERRQEWARIRSGAARVVVGPRSAVFAPVEGLGIVVVDEEHDASYKQDSTPRYHGRDLALVRARSAGAVAVLVSATPSLETRHNVASGRYQVLGLTERVGVGRLPEGIVVDLRKEPFRHRPGEVHFSTTLIGEIERALVDDGQVILLRNRRGFAPLLLCRSCGEDFRCADCGLPRTLHRRQRVLLCHYCGSTHPVVTTCPKCAQESLEPIGAGTERVEEQVRSLFPDVPVDVLDRDAAQRPGGAAAILERFRVGRSRILIGTQMISKGHHFPSVVLTAVLSADSYLGFPDFRAVERTYSLLTQLAGRAGRGARAGRVVIQTHYPDHYAIRAAIDHDDERFAAEELRFRRIFHYPPFTRALLVLVRHAVRATAQQKVQEIGAALRRHPLGRELRIAGPAPAPLERLRGLWRFQLLVRSTSHKRLRELAKSVGILTCGSDVVVDVDPYDLL